MCTLNENPRNMKVNTSYNRKTTTRSSSVEIIFSKAEVLLHFSHKIDYVQNSACIVYSFKTHKNTTCNMINISACVLLWNIHHEKYIPRSQMF